MLDYLVEPWTHQKIAIEKSESTNDFAFFFEVGAGKTMACINALRIKYNKHKKLLRTIVFVPPVVLEKWRQEILTHSKVNEKDIVILYGSGKKRCEILEKIGSEPKIILTNYESLTMGGKGKIKGPVFQALCDYYAEVLVFDESQRLKNPSAARTKAATHLADKAQYKYLLSGTPILNSPLDIFSQFRILDGGRSFGNNFFVFRGRYFKDLNQRLHGTNRYYPKWVLKNGALEEINKKLFVRSLSVRKEDCIDMPPLVKVSYPIEMTKTQAIAYKSMAKHFLAEVEDGVAVAELAMTKALRLQQIVSGFVNVENSSGETVAKLFKDNPRKTALKDLLLDITVSNKVIVWAVFKQNYVDIRDVCDSLKLNYVEINGEVSNKKKIEAQEVFNNDPDCKVLIGHPGSGGVGIDLIEATHSIYYSRSFSLEYDIQSEARNYRGGSNKHEKITRIDLVTPNTIDEQVLNALRDKKQIGIEMLKRSLYGSGK